MVHARTFAIQGTPNRFGLSLAQTRHIEFVAEKMTLLSPLELAHVLNSLRQQEERVNAQSGYISYSSLQDMMLNDRELSRQQPEVPRRTGKDEGSRQVRGLPDHGQVHGTVQGIRQTGSG